MTIDTQSFLLGVISTVVLIILGGVGGGLLLRFNRDRPSGVRLQLEGPDNAPQLKHRRPA